MQATNRQERRYYYLVYRYLGKGQLISKEIFLGFKSPKKQAIFFEDFCPMGQIKKILLVISSTIDWLPKFATGLNMIIGCSSKSMWVMKLFFCQNDPLMGEPFWQNNSLVSHILFELQPIIISSPVANFGNQSLILHI